MSSPPVRHSCSPSRPPSGSSSPSLSLLRPEFHVHIVLLFWLLCRFLVYILILLLSTRPTFTLSVSFYSLSLSQKKCTRFIIPLQINHLPSTYLASSTVNILTMLINLAEKNSEDIPKRPSDQRNLHNPLYHHSPGVYGQHSV